MRGLGQDLGSVDLSISRTPRSQGRLSLSSINPELHLRQGSPIKVAEELWQCNFIRQCYDDFLLWPRQWMTRELTWRPVPFDAKVRDLFDGTQVADVLLKLEFLYKSTTCSFPQKIPATCSLIQELNQRGSLSA